MDIDYDPYDHLQRLDLQIQNLDQRLRMLNQQIANHTWMLNQANQQIRDITNALNHFYELHTELRRQVIKEIK